MVGEDGVVECSIEEGGDVDGVVVPSASSSETVAAVPDDEPPDVASPTAPMTDASVAIDTSAVEVEVPATSPASGGMTLDAVIDTIIDTAAPSVDAKPVNLVDLNAADILADQQYSRVRQLNKYAS